MSTSPVLDKPMKARHGPWLLRRELGRGAFGVTYDAEGPSGLRVALKLLKVHPSAEIRALSAISHPCVPRLVDSGTTPTSWVAFDLVHGSPLTQDLAKGALPEALALQHAAALFDALAHIHHDGVAHGDIKPDNLLVDGQTGELRLVDFGLSDQRAGGTPAYSAPEVSYGEGGCWSDVYSAGLVLWEMLFGELPWPALGVVEGLLKRRGEAPVPPKAAGWLTHLFARALCPIVESRASAAELRTHLADHGAPLPAVGRRELLDRATKVHVERSEDASLADWVLKGGALHLEAQPGEGASHQLGRCELQLRAAGRLVHRLIGATDPWVSIENALRDPRLGPPEPFPAEDGHWPQVVAAATCLAKRNGAKLAILIDASEQPDSYSSEVLELLESEGLADVLWFHPSKVPSGDALEEWSAIGFRTLAEALLPGLALEMTVCGAIQDAGAGPRGLVLALVAALDCGELRRASHGYVLDQSRLLSHLRDTRSASIEGLGTLSRQIGCFLAVGGPSQIGELSLAFGVDVSEALAELMGARLVLGGAGRLSLNPVFRKSFLDAEQLDAEIWLALLSQAERTGASPARCLELAVRAGRRPAISRFAVSGLRSMCPHRAEEASRLGLELAHGYGGPELCDARLHASICLGELDAAFELSEAASEAGRLELCRALAGAGEAGRALELLGGLGTECVSIGHRLTWAAVLFRVGDLEQAAAIAQERGVVPENAEGRRAWAQLAVVHTQVLLAAGKGEQAMSVLKAVRGHPEMAENALILAAQGRILIRLGRMSEARGLLSSLVDNPGSLSVLDQSRTLLNLGTVFYMSSERQRAVAMWERSLILFERLRSSGDCVRIGINLTVACRESGRFHRAIETGLSAVEGARTAGLKELEAVAWGNLGEAYATDGQVPLAREAFDQCQSLAESCGLDGELLELARRRAELDALHAPEQAMASALKAFELASRAGNAQERSRSQVLLVLGRARLGQGEDIDDTLSTIEAPLVQAGLATDLAVVRGWAARAYMALGRKTSARELLDRVLLYAREVEHVEIEQQAHRLRESLGEVEGEDAGLERLLDLTQSLRSDAGQEELLKQVCSAALELLPQAERAFVALGNPPVLACAVVRDGVVEPPPSTNILRRAVQSGREILATDLEERGDLQGFQSVADMRMRSVLCVPMVEAGVPIGALYMDSYTATQGELRRTIRILRGLATFAALAVATVRVREQEQRQREMAESLEIALADAKRATRAKDRFLANMSHELRTPMNGVLGMLDLMEHSDLNADQQEMLATIRGSGDSLLTLISQVLDYARLEDGAQRAASVPMNLLEVCEGALGLVASSIEAKGMDLVARIPPALWTMREGDPVRLQQVLCNLLSNAVRFSDAGGQVVLSVRPVDASQISFSVEDQGCGIAADQLERVFAPFSQADESNHRSHGGAGLGLSIARETAALMGGELVCVSRVGQGSTFTLTLTMAELGSTETHWPILRGRRIAIQVPDPELEAQLRDVLQSWGAQPVTSLGGLDDVACVIRSAEATGPIPDTEIIWIHPPGGGGLTRPVCMRRLSEVVSEELGISADLDACSVSEPGLGSLPQAKVMVVEDNPINRMVICRMLRTMGLEIVEAWDGLEALERYTPDLDLILMDCQLPKMDGYEATRRLRAQGVQAPIIAVTARAQPGDRALCLDAGMDDYLTKPLALPVLVRSLRSWLKSKAKLGTA